MNKEISEFVGCVVHSSAFRRMQDKTQLYYTSSGDHYHTRLTHSVEVMAIAQEIAEKIQEWLKTNEKKRGVTNITYKKRKTQYMVTSCCIDIPITQAIALFHDIGHTPFGHVGERSISTIMSGESNEFSFIMEHPLTKFKHNVQSMNILKRQLDVITAGKKNDEKKQYGTMVWKILDGVCKHTRVFEPGKGGKDDYGISPIITDTVINDLQLDYGIIYPELNVPLSLEGQIVAIADEIAQRVSDYDDIIRAGEYELLASIIKDAYCNVHDEASDYLLSYSQKVLSLGRKKATRIDYAIYESVLKNCREVLIADVLDSFTKNFGKEPFYGIKLKNGDVLQGSIVNISHSEKTYLPVIHFGAFGKSISDGLETACKQCAIDSYCIRRCDNNSAQLIDYLFGQYYNNPRLLPDNTISMIISNIQHYYEKQNNCKKAVLEDEFKFTSLINAEDVLAAIDSTKACFSYFSAKERINKDVFTVAKHIHGIYVREIAYYIAGMTDSFATREYRKLKGIERHKSIDK